MPNYLWEGRWRGREPVGDIHRRARKVISPSGGIIRGKFPSRKNGRMVYHEGLLELDAAYLFEASPKIVLYREQPRTIRYPDGAKLRRYTPDFEVLLENDQLVTIEIKPSQSLARDEVARSLKCVEAHLQRTDESFLVLTEESIRLEPRLSNLRWIHQRTPRIPITRDAGIAALLQCADALPCSLALLIKLLECRRVSPFSLFLLGLLTCDLTKPLELTTEVNLITENDHEWFRISEKYSF